MICKFQLGLAFSWFKKKKNFWKGVGALAKSLEIAISNIKGVFPKNFKNVLEIILGLKKPRPGICFFGFFGKLKQGNFNLDCSLIKGRFSKGNLAFSEKKPFIFGGFLKIERVFLLVNFEWG